MAETNKPPEPKQSVSQASKDNARAAEGAVRQGADAVGQVGRATGDALRQGSEMVADMDRRGVEAGADAARRYAEAANDTARRSAQAVAEAQRRLVQDAAKQFEEASRKVAEAAQGTTENIRCLMALPNAAEGGLRDLQQGMAGLVEGVTRTNLRAAQELFRLANPAPIVELQQRFVRGYTDSVAASRSKVEPEMFGPARAPCCSSTRTHRAR